MEKAKRNLKDFLLKKGAEFIAKNIETVNSLVLYQFANEKIEEKIRERTERCEPILLIINHQSHFDSVAVGKIASMISEKGLVRREDFSGFAVPMAASVTSGDQSKAITYLFEALEPWYKKMGIEFFPFVRKKDETKYGMDPNKGLRNLATKITEFEEGRLGIGVFVEGSVQGGREKNKEEPFGIIEAKEATLASGLILRASAKEREISILSIGISGTYNIFSPDSRMPTLRCIAGFLHNKYSPVFLPRIRLATVTIGDFYSSNEITIPQYSGRKAPDTVHASINRQTLQRVSLLIPHDQRGIFKSRNI